MSYLRTTAALARAQRSGTLSARRSLTTTPIHYSKPTQDDPVHKPSMGGSSFGHLISEISATKPGMEAQRVEGKTMSEEQRTFARRIVFWVMGVPTVLGGSLVVAHVLSMQMG
ncbi:hypothetical protein M8818_005537 [Zalaria obscura]|uniref:Uncharacterized protein n=1 Tax=Zalaria obscura TaxID=2024903 RepID=A0ACC3S8T1_9PEZI